MNDLNPMKGNQKMPEKESVEITVSVPIFWYKLCKNKYFAWFITGFLGVSVSFAPLLLHMLGEMAFPVYHWAVLICFLIIYIVPGCYMKLGSLVLQEITKHEIKAKAQIP